MADNILLVGNKYRVLDSQGFDYEKNKNIKRNFYYLRLLLNTGFFAISALFGGFTYYLGSHSNPALILTAIVTIVMFIFSCCAIDDIKTAFNCWQKASAQYNAALVNSQEAITKARYKAQEDLARHQAHLKAISLEQKFSFQSKTEVEKSINS